MKALRNYLDKIKPNFEEGGKLAMFRSVFDGFETFLFVPNETSKTGVHIHDCIDSKRAMTVVIIALLPALLFGMYNVGYQHNLAVGADPGFLMTFIFGFLAVLPKIIVSYVVGLGIEFAVAQVKKEEIQEGFRYLDSDDRSGRYSVMDDRRSYCFRCYFRERGIWWYGI